MARRERASLMARSFAGTDHVAKLGAKEVEMGGVIGDRGRPLQWTSERSMKRRSGWLIAW